MTIATDTLPSTVSLDAVRKTYGSSETAVTALNDVSLELPRGTFTAVMGPSGSGKSTLLHCASGLDRPTSGRVVLGGTDIGGLKESTLAEFRRERIGFVFQAYNLLDALTVEQNIVLPLRLAGRSYVDEQVRELIESVGLDIAGDRRPSTLSGGQQQRVAIARALITRPEAVFLDEPTGALDSRTARQILTLLRRTVDEWDQTALMVTHDPVAASYADDVVFLADGQIVARLPRSAPDVIAEHMAHLGTY